MANGPAEAAGRPVAAKLGLTPGMTVALVGAPAGWEPDGTAPGIRLHRRRRATPADVVICFSRRRADLDRRIGDLGPMIGARTALWLLWPRKAAGHESDLGDETVRAAGLSMGLVDVKVAAVGEDWSGLRFVQRAGPAAAR